MVFQCWLLAFTIICNQNNAYDYFIYYLYLLGIGFGMLNSPITITAIEGMPLSQSGTAAAIAVTCKQIGNF